MCPKSPTPRGKAGGGGGGGVDFMKFWEWGYNSDP